MTNRTGNSVCVPRNPEASRKKAPRLVLGMAVPGGPDLADAVQRLGWEVSTPAAAADLRRLAERGRVAAVVLPATGGAESGMLTCAKLTRINPRLRVVLVGPDDDGTERFARFVGAAAYVRAGATVGELLRAVCGE